MNFSVSALNLVFQPLYEGEVKLRSLDESGINMLNLDPDVLAVSLNKVTNLSIRRSRTYYYKSNDQLEYFFTQMLSTVNQTKLKRLDLRGTDLSRVNSSLLGRAINTIEVVIMKSCGLSNEQIEAIFKNFGESSKIRKLNIKYNGTYKHDLWEWSQKLKWNHELNIGVDVRYGHDSNYPGSDEHDFEKA